MLTFRSLAAGALSEAAAYTAHLLEKTLPDEQMILAAYYGRGADMTGSVPTVRADLDPRLSQALGLTAGAVLSEKELGAILSGRRADATPLPGKKQPRRVKTKDGKQRFKVSGMDLCFSAPKSVSVAWAFAETDAERNSILQAHRDARDAALKYIEQEIGGRIGAKGKQLSAASRMAWIVIDHFTARATIDITRPDPVTGVMGTELYTLGPNTHGDMQLHTHCIVPNITVAADGRVVALNTMKFHGRKKEFGAVYQAFLAKNLRAMGIEVDLCERNLMAKLPIIPDTVCDEFSKRTGDAESSARAAAKLAGLDWDAMSIGDKVSMLKSGANNTRRAKADDLANFEAWHEQAERIGWKHKTAVAYGPPSPTDGRLEGAIQTALPLLDTLFAQRSVIFGAEARLQAVRGLIKWGIETTADIGAVTKRMVTNGVTQNGRWTRLRWAETDRGVKITTELHVEQEAELIDLAKTAVANKSRSLSLGQIEAAVQRKGMSFKGDHGRKQREGMDALGIGGELAVLIGIAGSGKTTLLSPLVDAWKSQGLTVFGLAVAWRQAGALKDAGIERLKVRALQNFLTGVQEGWTKIDSNSVVVVDELGQIGTRQLLELLRLQKQYGFKIVAVGDQKQCQSVEAGEVIGLLSRACEIPEILTTIRQRTEREREIAGKFRDGSEQSVMEAINHKLEDGTAELCEGGYREAVERVADLAMEHGNESLTLSAPTNADALAISRAIRSRRNITGPEVTIAATNGKDTYDLALAPGDKVRLFERTRGRYESGKVAHVGDNGSIVEIVSVQDDGMEVKGESGKVAFVEWLKEGGRVKLAYGDCLTVDSAQGLTSDYHIFAVPGGSAHVDAFRAYVASSRHRVRSWMIVSKAEEMREIALRRPLGTSDTITDENIWSNVARNLARQDMKESATAFLEKAAENAKKSVHTFQSGMRKLEARKARGKKTRAKEMASVQVLSRAIAQLATQAGELQKDLSMPVKVSEHEARAQFSSFLQSAGFDLRGHEPVFDGKWHNVPLVGQKGHDKSGGYVAYLDCHPAGAIHNHKTGERRTWKAHGETVQVSQEEADRLARELKARRDARHRAEALQHEAKAEKARAMFAKASPANPDHPYLKRKGVGAHGIRQIGANLVIPLVDPKDGRIWNLQFITPDGVKRPLSGARKQGLIHMLGEAEDGKEIGLSEGYATAASVHEALGIPVAMAIDSGNLVPAARDLRKRYMNSSILVAGDHDASLAFRNPPLPNVGKVKAEEAAREAGGKVTLPPLDDPAISKDWNDHSGRHGLLSAAAALRKNQVEVRDRPPNCASASARRPVLKR